MGPQGRQDITQIPSLLSMNNSIWVLAGGGFMIAIDSVYTLHFSCMREMMQFS